jgi:hypothetical protein
VSKYLEQAARLLKKAEQAAEDDGAGSEEYHTFLALAREYAKLAEIERGPVPAYVVTPGMSADPSPARYRPPSWLFRAQVSWGR